MKVLIDTNILISATLGQGTPFRAYVKAATFPNQGVICDQNIDEMRRVFNRKFPQKIPVMERFLSLALQTLDVVRVPARAAEQERKVRDVYDRPILRAALAANVDVLLTGDRDFLEAGITEIRIMNPSAFLQLDGDSEP